MKYLRNVSVAVAFLIAIGTFQLHAQSGDYLKAPVLARGEDLLLIVDQDDDKSFRFSRVEKCLGDTSRTKLDDNWAVLNQTKMQVAICNYNPLKWKFSLTQKETDSSAWTNLQTIFSAAGDFVKAITPLALAEKEVNPCQLEVTVDSADAWFQELAKQPEKWSLLIDDAYKRGEMGPMALYAAQEAAGDQADVAKSHYDAIKGAIRTFDPSKCATAAKDEASGTKDVTPAAKDNSSGAKNAPEPLTLAEEHLLVRAENHLKALSTVETALRFLVGSLKATSEKGIWVGEHDNALVIGKPVQTSLKKSKNVTITATPLDYALAKPDAFGATPGDAVPLAILVERWWVLYPSPGAGPMFTTFEKPVYVAADSGSQKVVSLKKMQRLDASLSGSLNWVPHLSWHGIAPYLQVGFTNTNDVNGLLLGGGLRLFGFGKTDVGISGGSLIGWYKDLNHLKLNDVVADQDAIDNDLTRHVKTAPFACIQIKF